MDDFFFPSYNDRAHVVTILHTLSDFGPQFHLELTEKSGIYFPPLQYALDRELVTREDIAGLWRYAITPKGLKFLREMK